MFDWLFQCCSANNQENEGLQQQTKLFDYQNHIEPDLTSHSAILPLTDSPSLKLIVLDGVNIKQGAEFTIQSNGLIGGNRKDGVVYFGNQAISSEGELLNDFVFPREEKGIGRRHMVIQFSYANKTYYIKDLGEGSGTFIRIDFPIKLKQGNIVSFGDSHMSVAISQNHNIAFKFLDGSKVDQIFKFSKEEKNIMIGRMLDCKIRFDDNSLSRYQCIISYINDNQSWILQDGDGLKSSTNGTWLYIDDYLPIVDKLVFKLGQTLLMCSLQ